MMRDQGLWFWHVAAGAAILVLAGLHMGIMHLDVILGIGNPAGGHPIDWANVVARGKSAAFLVSYVLLLGAALFHGLYGLRNILYELTAARGLRGLCNVILILMGLALFILGTWAAVAGRRTALAA
jgi:succinate dehydrogenase / fumarate reductase membrane anchor subunit